SNSTSAGNFTDVIPEPALPPVAEQVLNALGEPSLSSLGLCSYWPSGWYQSLLETCTLLELPCVVALALRSYGRILLHEMRFGSRYIFVLIFGSFSRTGFSHSTLTLHSDLLFVVVFLLLKRRPQEFHTDEIALHLGQLTIFFCPTSIATLVIRLSLFPFIISQRRNLAKYTEAMPTLTLLQERMTKARLSGDYFESEFHCYCFQLRPEIRGFI
ncbi:Preprotein translocase YidC subunit, partial [Fasciola gigantica]